MLRFFDKDFFKFLIGFLAIVMISLVTIAVLHQFELGSSRSDLNTAISH